MDIDLSLHSASERYHMLTQAVIPRPVAWILTQDETGITNLAPYSFFAPVCSEPPTLVVSIGHKPDGNEKDTFNNLKASGRCVLQIASVAFAAPLNLTSATLAAGQSEADEFGIELQTVPGWSLPVVAGIPVAFLCRYQQQVDLGPGNQHVVFLEAERLYLKDGLAEATERLTIASEDIDPLARLGAAEYAALGQRMKIRRPQ